MFEIIFVLALCFICFVWKKAIPYILFFLIIGVGSWTDRLILSIFEPIHSIFDSIFEPIHEFIDGNILGIAFVVLVLGGAIFFVLQADEKTTSDSVDMYYKVDETSAGSDDMYYVETYEDEEAYDEIYEDDEGSSFSNEDM